MTFLWTPVVKGLSIINPLNANPAKWSNTFKQKPTNCLSVFDHFVELAGKGLRFQKEKYDTLPPLIHQSWYPYVEVKIFQTASYLLMFAC